MNFVQQDPYSGLDRNQANDCSDRTRFLEDMGLLFESMGIPRMAGRIFGWLLISNPPHQTPSEMATALQASKASMSTMTRLLLQMGLIERLRIPGQRQDYFRLPLNAWTELRQQQLIRIRVFRQLAERGLALLSDSDRELRRRLEDMRDLHDLLERELPQIIARWEQQRSASATLPSSHPSLFNENSDAPLSI